MEKENLATEIIRKSYDFAKRNIDFKKGAIFGSLAGLAVGLINCREGLEYALSSGAKEGLKCLAIGTMNLSICEALATSIENKAKAYFVATIVPTVLSIGLTYGVHAYLKGTPHPLESTAPTALSAPFFAYFAVRERNLEEKKKQNLLGERK